MDYARFLRRRAVNIGLQPSDARLLGDWFMYQVQNQGLEGSINYLKRVGSSLIRYVTGEGDPAPWVGTQHGLPRKLMFLRKYSADQILRLAKMARAIRLPEATVKQVGKVVASATRPASYTEAGLQRGLALVRTGAAKASLKPVKYQPRNPPLVGDQFRRVMSVSGPTSVTFEPPFKESLELVSSTPAMAALPYWKEAFQPWVNVKLIPELSENHTVGEIHATQEGGGKCRMYAAPYTIFQVLLDPIHKWIVSFLRRLETNCTWNQESGARWAQDQLKMGRTVHSVDLSTATCRFPLELQISILDYLGLGKPYIDAFIWASRGVWLVGQELQPTFPATISWTVGQPLGIKPSMSSFALAHNLLLWGICAELGYRAEECFRVLGDDVVISDDDVHAKYIEAIQGMDIPISHDKSYSSSVYAEFAGYSITRDSLVRPGQFRLAERNNHLSIALDLRTALRGEVSQKWLDLELVYLFYMGIYNPEKEHWPRYVRLATALAVDLMELRLEFLRGSPWIDGFTRCVRSAFPDSIINTFGGVYWETVFRALKVPDGHLAMRWKEYLINATGDEPDAQMVYTFCFMALLELLETGEISLDEFADRKVDLRSRACGLLWLPPVGDRESAGSLHKRLSRAVISL